MKGQCCICTELFETTSDVSATLCGHTFHARCLRQWLEQSKTCPHCRKKVNERHIVDKLFFDVADESGDDDEDLSALKNQLSDLKLRVKQKDKEKKELQDEKAAIEGKMGELRDSFRTMDQLYRQERNNLATLKKEISFHKELQKEAQFAKEEAKMLRQKLGDLKNVDLVVNGNEDDIRRIISNGDVKQLSTWCSVLQKELLGKRAECRTLRETTDKLKKESSSYRRTAAEKTDKASTAEKLVKTLRLELSDADREVMSLKKKINALEKALGSPSDTARSFAHRLIHESPAPMMTPPTKKPKLTDPGENMSSPDMFNSPALSNRDFVELAQESPSILKNKDRQETRIKFMNIKTASNSGTNKKSQSEISDISNIHGLGSYNLFKKKNGMGLADSGSAIRKGYNGLGGHEKFITPQGFTGFKAPVPVKKQTNKFGPSRSVATKRPPLPTLDGFMAQD